MWGLDNVIDFIYNYYRDKLGINLVPKLNNFFKNIIIYLKNPIMGINIFTQMLKDLVVFKLKKLKLKTNLNIDKF